MHNSYTAQTCMHTLCVCVCVHVRVYVRACVHVYVCECSMCMCVCVCVIILVLQVVVTGTTHVPGTHSTSSLSHENCYVVLASSPGSPSFCVNSISDRSNVIRGIIVQNEGDPGDKANVCFPILLIPRLSLLPHNNSTYDL